MSLTDDIEDYWNRRSNGFSSAVREELETEGDSISDKLEGCLSLERGSKVLDVGCGPGLFSILLARCGMDVVGIDSSERMIEEARSNARSSGVDPRFMRMDAQSMEFDDGGFDAVVSRNVIWTLVNPESCYSEMLRVLRPGGRILVMDGNFYLDRSGRRDTHRGRGTDLHGRHNTDGVDFGIIERLAEDLPLSKEERPAWDVGVLCRYGCTDIRITLPERSGDPARSFTIIASREGTGHV